MTLLPQMFVVIFAGQVMASAGTCATVTVKVRDKIEQTHRVIFDCRAVNQKAEEVITGTADVIAPTEKISRPRIILPEVELRQKGRRYELLLKMSHGLDPIRTAVVHPVDTPSLLGAVEAARINLITPVLVGPEAKIRAAAALAQRQEPVSVHPRATRNAGSCARAVGLIQP